MNFLKCSVRFMVGADVSVLDIRFDDIEKEF